MNKFVQVDNGVVTATLEATSAPPSDVCPDGRMFVDVEEFPALLSTYDASTGLFTAPLVIDHGVIVSPRMFLQLFTPAQRKAIRRVSATDEDVADFMALAQVPEPIRLKHPSTLAGLQLLVTKGVLTQVEATRISNNQPPTA